MGHTQQVLTDSSPIPQDRRTDPRYKCGGTATLFRIAEPDGKPIGARICNLSMGGCCLESEAAFGIGTQLAVALAVKKSTLRVIGQVRALKLDDRCGLSLEFVGISEADLQVLSELIAQMK